MSHSSSGHVPAADAVALLADVQSKTLRGIVWAILAYCPVQVALWHFPGSANRSALSITFEVVLVVGAVLQYLSLRRGSIRTSGILLTCWLVTISALAWITSGPRMGCGIVLVFTVLVSIFFVGQRAGAFVLAGFGAVVICHAFLADQGLVALPASGARLSSASALIRMTIPSFAALTICYIGMARIHRALFRALTRMAEERQSRDVAEAAQRHAEETMRANQHFEALGKLTSGVAHDVNNALTTIFCNAELLLDSPVGPEERGRARDILAAAQSAAQTTRQLLSLNRRAFCQPANVDPAQVATTVTRLVARLMPGNIRVRVDARTRRLILVDPSDLQQALLNLLLNSRDAMPDGGEITLEISDRDAGAGTSTRSPFASAALVSTHHVVVRVIDTGRGIAPETQARIFDPFFTTKPAGKGTGLGLAMVKAFVEEAGGTVAVDSKLGAGTRITLLFPESRERDESIATTADVRLDPTGQTILLIEDQLELRELMERSLVRGGYRVTTTATTEEALALLAAGQSYDLLCSDGLKGSTPIANLVARFRDRRPSAPVVICSGHIDHELSQGGLTPLRVELLRKPFTGTELLTCVGRTLRQQRIASTG